MQDTPRDGRSLYVGSRSLFLHEERVFALRSPSVSTRAPVRTDHPMTRNRERDRIRRARATARTARGRPMAAAASRYVRVSPSGNAASVPTSAATVAADSGQAALPCVVKDDPERHA